MTYKHKNIDTCSTQVQFDIKSGKIYNVRFQGGCNGNLKGIGALIEGMDAGDVMEKLKGIKCGFKSTSCPDQLSRAIEEVLKGDSTENLQAKTS
ncbi:MAG TPA: TIGR03905 family TSCPD domain-containing protein [Ruminiclostridium sp.]|nr:TIGR03905 family TSCPD domain-containing protein [Ruminiclostridium sp.]